MKPNEKAYVRLIDPSGSHYIAEQDISLIGHIPKEVVASEYVLNLVKMGIAEEVSKKEALAFEEEQREKREEAASRAEENEKYHKKVAEVEKKSRKLEEENKKLRAELDESKKSSDLDEVDPEGTIADLVQNAVNLDVIKKSGNWYKHGSHSIGNGFDATVTALAEDEDLYNQIAEETEKAANED